MRCRKLFCFVLLMVFSAGVLAETMYVTDHILLGVHQEPQEESLLIKSIVSGTAVEVLESQGDFSKVRLVDGTEGWVSTGYLNKEKPSVVELDKLYAKYEESSKSLKLINEKLSKRERELQIRRDELSNAKTTIKELKKKLSAGGNVATVDNEALQAAEKKVELLSQQLAEVTAAKEAIEKSMQNIGDIDITQLQQENANLRARIQSAQANLSGETVPSPEQLAAIRPEFPGWYWGLLLLCTLLGAIGGILWLDYRHRVRHGGFRL